jgi:hypothetical protein
LIFFSESTLSHFFLKEPVRLLEAQMASLRVSFTNWTENEPEEIEDPYPTDEMLANFQFAEERHAKEV